MGIKIFTSCFSLFTAFPAFPACLAFLYSLPFLMKQYDEGEADDHEKGAHKPFPDIRFLEKQASEENAHEEA